MFSTFSFRVKLNLIRVIFVIASGRSIYVCVKKSARHQRKLLVTIWTLEGVRTRANDRIDRSGNQSAENIFYKALAGKLEYKIVEVTGRSRVSMGAFYKFLYIKISKKKI